MKKRKRKQWPVWSRAELRLLGRMTDREAAKKTGRTTRAVFHRRNLLGRPKPDSRHPSWTPREDALVARLSCQEAARRTGRSLMAVRRRRRRLGVAGPFPVLRKGTGVGKRPVGSGREAAGPLHWDGQGGEEGAVLLAHPVEVPPPGLDENNASCGRHDSRPPIRQTVWKESGGGRTL